MKSIRLSLTLCFVGLLTLALGAVAIFVYQHTEESLREEQEIKEKLIRSRHQAHANEQKAQMDNALKSQAGALASLLRFHYDRRSIFHAATATHKSSAAAGFISSAFMPNAQYTLPVWAYEGRWRSHFWFRHYIQASDRIRTEIRLEQENLLRPITPGAQEYFQINSSWGGTVFSPNMNGRTFAFDPSSLKDAKLMKPSFETVRLGRNRVRVVKIKVIPTRSVPGLPSRSGFSRKDPRKDPHSDPHKDPKRKSSKRSGWGRDRSRRGPSSSRWIFEGDRPSPTLFIQYATDIKQHRKVLTELAAKRDEDLWAVGQERTTSLSRVRNYLLALMGGTFALGALGCFWLVRVGLSPLRRLSDAVSRVSEKDFRLQFDNHHIPKEVIPIVERLTSTLEMLKRAFAREKQATADISHDLRTPVAALLTTVDFALKKPRSAEEYREALVDCRLSGQQMNQIVEQLLNLARLDAGVAQMQTQPVNVSELAEQCVNLVRPLAELRGLSLSFQSVSTEPVRADAAKLREVLNNLLQNAIQYNQPNGSIQVEIHRQDGQLELRVSDTGIGIPKECQSLVFERFYRADPSRHSDDLNVGLGLAIVQGYVDLMGGRLTLQSAEGEGSTFRIYLPA